MANDLIGQNNNLDKTIKQNEANSPATRSFKEIITNPNEMPQNQKDFIALQDELKLSAKDLSIELKITTQQVYNLIAGRNGVSDQLLDHLQDKKIIRGLKERLKK